MKVLITDEDRACLYPFNSASRLLIYLDNFLLLLLQKTGKNLAERGT